MMPTGADNSYMKLTRENESKGTIVGYIPAGNYNSPRQCTLELTDIPQYSVVEIVINRYVLPSGCFCTSNGISNCNRITIIISNNVKRFCSPTTDPVYMYKSDNNVIKIVSTIIYYNRAVNFGLTYRGEYYKPIFDY